MKGSNYVKLQVQLDSSLVIELLLCVLLQEYYQLIIARPVAYQSVNNFPTQTVTSTCQNVNI